jgi:glycosyltransferase involved in cell wall biosynthesis
MNAERKPRVSIGLPVYNGEKYLEQALDAILAQTFRDFELVILDNASTDLTDEICRDYAAKDQRIRYFRNETNIGVARNFNRVFELSSGEYFKWSAHDDLIAPDWLKRCVETLDREPQAIMCYPKTTIIDEHGEVLDYLEDNFDLHSPQPHVRFHQSFHSSGWCHPQFGLIRAKVLKRMTPVGSYASSDKVFLGELALRGECHEVPERLAFLRIHPQTSIQASETDRDLATWIDPLSDGTIIAPRMKRLVEHLKTIRFARVGIREEILCYLALARWYLSPQRLRGAFLEFLTICRSIVDRVRLRKE